VSTQPSPFENLFQEELYQIPGRTVIISSKNWTEVSDEERTVLSKMLAAVKLNLASVQILHLQKFSLQDLQAFSPARVLVFGATIQEVSQLYTNTLVDNVPVIVADSIDKLDDAKKKSLWLALKQMFGI